MKRSLAVAVGTAFLLAAGTASTQDARALASNPAVIVPQSGATTGMGGRMAQMDEHMQMMKTLHEKLMSAATPKHARS